MCFVRAKSVFYFNPFQSYNTLGSTFTKPFLLGQANLLMKIKVQLNSIHMHNTRSLLLHEVVDMVCKG